MKTRMVPFSLLTLLVISVCVFIFFKSFNFDSVSGFTVEILAAFLGAILTMIITAILLNAQTDSEVNREKSIGVFQAKIDIYTEFLEDINKMIYDGKIDEEEVIKLRNWALKLGLFAGENVYNILVDFINQSLMFQKFRYEELTDEEKLKWEIYVKEKYGIEKNSKAEPKKFFITIGEIIANLRKDLGENNIKSDSDSVLECINEIIYLDKNKVKY